MKGCWCSCEQHNVNFILLLDCFVSSLFCNVLLQKSLRVAEMQGFDAVVLGHKGENEM